MSEFFAFLSDKYNPPKDTTSSFDGKTVLITGGTAGLGLEAAKKYAALKASRLIITARDAARGQRAKEEIETHAQSQGTTTAKVEVWALDMSSFGSIRTFAERVDKDLAKLDVVQLNAGQANVAWEASPEGWEQTLKVNAIGTTYLAILLLPRLSDTAAMGQKEKPHLNFVSSGNVARLKRGDVQKYRDDSNALAAMRSEKDYAGAQGQYDISKLVLEYCMRHIARLPSVVTHSGQVRVVVNSTCPGMCKSDLGRKYREKSVLLKGLLWASLAIFARTGESGSRSYISAVTRGEDGQGKLWKNDQYSYAGEMIESEESAKFSERVWDEMLEVLENEDTKVREIVGRE